MISRYLYIMGWFALLPFFTKAQPAAYAVNTEFTIWNIAAGDTAYVYVDKAYLRDYPGLQGKIVDSLSAGTLLIIKSEAFNGNQIKGFSAPWHEVVYQEGDKTKTGFIWLGLLALGHKQDAGGNQYLYGYDKFYPASEELSAYYMAGIKLIRPEQQAASTFSFKVDAQGQTYTECKLLPSMGLTGLEQIFRVSFLGEACGIPSNYYYAGWNGQAFVAMPSRYAVSDAGIFYYEEKISFPSEHQKEANIVYKYIEEGEVIDEESENLDYKIKKREEKYSWDGRQFSLLQNTK